MIKLYFNEELRNVTQTVLDKNKELLYNLAYNQLIIKPETTSVISLYSTKAEVEALVYSEMLHISDIRQFDRHSLLGQNVEKFLNLNNQELEDINCAEVTDLKVTFVNNGDIWDSLGIDKLEFTDFCKSKNIQLIL